MFGVNYDNPWIADVETARRRAPAWAVALLAVAWAALVLFSSRGVAPTLHAAVGAILHGFAEPWPAIGSQSARRALVFIPLLALALAAGRFEGRPLWRAGSRPILATLAGFGLGAGGLFVCVAIAALAGVVTIGATSPFSAPLAGLAVGIAGVVFQTATEEVYFRGWLQPLCCSRWGPWLGLAATAALFTVLHLIGGDRSLLSLGALFLGGLMFGLLALRSGGLWAPWAAHFAWNWTESGGLGLDPNPGVPTTGALIDLDLKGSGLWSGGADALNGSLATLITLAVIVAALASVRFAEAHRTGRG